MSKKVRQSYEKAFMSDMRAIDHMKIEATYSDDGKPNSDGITKRISEDGDLHSLLSNIMNEKNEVIGQDLYHRLFMAPFWKDSGRPIFNISSELAAALILTDLPDTIDIKSPFPAFILSIQSGKNTETPLVVDGQEYHGIAFFETSGDTGQTWAIWTMPKDESHNCVYQKIIDTTDMKEWVSNAPHSAPILRLILNFMVYLNAKKESGTLPGAKRAKFGVRKGSLVTSLGKDVKLNPNIIKAARGDSLGGPQYKLNKRFVVRGHFRNQGYGPRAEKQTRVTWIQPFWKGPDILEAAERTYTVE